MLVGCMTLDQGMVAGIGEGTGRGRHGHTRSPGTLKLGMTWCGRGVVRRRRRR